MRHFLTGIALVSLAGCASTTTSPSGNSKPIEVFRNSTCGVADSVWNGMTLEEKIKQEYMWANMVQTQGKSERWSPCPTWKNQKHTKEYRARHNGKSYECPVVGESAQICTVKP